MKTRNSAVAGHVLGFIRHHPEIAVVIAGVGARAKPHWPLNAFIPQICQPFLKSDTNNCIAASLVNAVFCVSGEATAVRFHALVDMESRIFLSLRPLGRLLCQLKLSATGCRITCERQMNTEIQKGNMHAAFQALAERKTGVLLVRVCDGRVVDHAFVVDASNSAIIDSEEHNPFKFSATALENCGGAEATNLRVQQFRRIEQFRMQHKLVRCFRK